MTNSRTIAERTVCITGASSGIGRAIAEPLQASAEGAVSASG